MVKKAHHRTVRHLLAGTLGTLGALAVSTQIASADHVIVKAGDTVWKIAQQHKTTVAALENANANTIKKLGNSVDLIYAGQQLSLPGSDATMQADENGRYTVMPGDTLSKIAEHFHVSVASLMAWNGLSSDQLYIGQQLIVEGQYAVSTGMTAQPTSSVVVNSSAPVASPVVAGVANTNPVSTAQSDSTVAGSQPQTNVVTPSATPSAANVANSAQGSAGVANSAVSAGSASADDQMAVAATTNSAVNTGTVTPSQSGSAIAPVSASSATVSAVPASSTVTVSAAPVSSMAANSSAASAVAQPVASQAPAVQSAAPQAVSQAPASQSTQAAVSAAPQQQGNAGQDLNSGSVVSLAVKIANSNSVPYVWGGSSMSGTDCSGLVDYVYAHAEGKQLPHNTVALESCVNQHAVSQAQAGDILFWGNHGATYHCAIYVGNNQFVAAAKPGTNVATYTISPYFQPSFAGTVK